MEKFRIPNVEDEKTILKTIRIKYSTILKIEELSKKYDISVNRLINECISFALDNLDEDSIKIKTKEELKDQDKDS